VYTTLAALADTVTAAAAAVGALGVIGIAYQVRESRLAREAEVTIDFSRRWDEELVRNARQTVSSTYTTPDALRNGLQQLKATKYDEYAALLAEPNYYEDLAVMCNSDMLDKRIIRESLGESLYVRWQMWAKAVDWLREDAKDKLLYVAFENLACEMRDDAAPVTRRLRDVLRERVTVWPVRKKN
jgi:hypothetical protein